MRFVLGLLFGASLTLLAVTTYTGQPPFHLEPDKLRELRETATTIIEQKKPAPAIKPVRTVPKPEPAKPEIQEPVVAVAPPPKPAPVEPTPTPETVAVSGRQAVWTPFRSEASAKGFAGRLSNVLGHPFDVERLAPQTYVVTFGYESEPERAALEKQVSVLTGGDRT